MEILDINKPVQPDSPKKPTRLRKGVKIAILATSGVAIFALGIGTGFVGTQPKVIEVTKTVEVKVPTTPSECLDALEKANDVMNVTGRTITLFQAAVQDAAAQNVAKLQSGVAEKDRLYEELSAEMASYKSYLQACKALR
ncbi:hypothetical protein CVV68_16950 [Arthrobacter livingstonensis]|uniref:Uncharacterized protein n=1 Tax=Arthrobacter livingstonensis TaxID=670078 RepID=A0A2V5L2X3_9MICC|nr:hypothetical protein [Arthrobacter livingstonensis]PYI65731.1 hypothetical protein CVV68_16950 [Arthrobacter livingstonensis]